MTHIPPRVLSLGAGVQSTTLLLAAIDRLIEPVDVAVFADTGWEPKAVYEHLDRLSRYARDHGVEVVRVSNGNIRNTDRGFACLPFFVEQTDGSVGISRRQCTNEYKLTPIKRFVRQLLGAPLHPETGIPGRVPKGRYAYNLVGISTDEVVRIKPSDVSYMVRRDPLVDDLVWNRRDCLDYLAERWTHGAVERSACIGCPFHSDNEWLALTPDEFADACDMDDELRTKTASGARTMTTGTPYLHRSMKPLREVKLIAKPEGWSEPSLFGPQSCSPFGCERSG